MSRVRPFSRDEGPLRWRRARRIRTHRRPAIARNRAKHQPFRHYARRAWDRPGGSVSRSAANPSRHRSLSLRTERNRRSRTQTLPTKRKRHGPRPGIAQRHYETPSLLRSEKRVLRCRLERYESTLSYPINTVEAYGPSDGRRASIRSARRAWADPRDASGGRGGRDVGDRIPDWPRLEHEQRRMDAWPESPGGVATDAAIARHDHAACGAPRGGSGPA